MIVQEEYVCKNGVVLTHTFSDKDLKILKVGTNEKYDEAYDIPNRYIYVETTEKIEKGD